MKHVGNWFHQAQIIKQRKTTLTDTDGSFIYRFRRELRLQICVWSSISAFWRKYRIQISSNTGVCYHADQIQSFCTASTDLDHTACAIFTHLEPIVLRIFTSLATVLRLNIVIVICFILCITRLFPCFPIWKHSCGISVKPGTGRDHQMEWEAVLKPPAMTRSLTAEMLRTSPSFGKLLKT